jgi:3-deoxy-7-phosphoheptulonate synthase
MRHVAELALTDPHLAAQTIVDELPPPGDYSNTYQPDYPDRHALVEGVHELQHTTPVTTGKAIFSHLGRMTAIATGELKSASVTTGPCCEELDASIPIQQMSGQHLVRRSVVLETVPGATPIGRKAGQVIKPRTSQYESVGGLQVFSYMGPGINGRDARDRTPDATRLVAAGVQARDLAEQMRLDLGGVEPISAHEALSLPYELAFTRIDPDTGEVVLTSAVQPWIGKRTNQLDGPHVRLFSEIANAVGVKIGADSNADHIAGLENALNPNEIPGKVTYMVRVGEDLDSMRRIARAIRAHAPESLVVYDLHGSTTVQEGHKVRHVDTIIRHAQMLAEECGSAGLMMAGVHLETTADPSRLECTDEIGQLPTHPGHVDPGLNARQLRYALTELTPYMPH